MEISSELRMRGDISMTNDEEGHRLVELQHIGKYRSR